LNRPENVQPTNRIVYGSKEREKNSILSSNSKIDKKVGRRKKILEETYICLGGI